MWRRWRKIDLMPYRKEINENFAFMALEATKQVEHAMAALESLDPVLISKVVSRDDYIDVLKNVIENKCYMHANRLPELDEQEINRLRFIGVISGNLEHIADYAVSIVEQCRYLSDPSFMHSYPYRAFFESIIGAMGHIVRSLEEGDVSTALLLCRCEREIDRLYEEVIARILEELRSGADPGDLLTATFIFRYLERMGDALLNIGEAIISSVVGEKLKVESYEAIEESLESVVGKVKKGGSAAFTYRQLAETQSGCSIGLVDEERHGETAKPVIFKEGRAEKILAERDKLQLWRDLNPGMAPRVFGVQESGESASMIIEYLRGETFQSILLGGDEELVGRALAAILREIPQAWARTLRAGTVRVNYVEQLLERLDDVLRVHPEFDRGRLCIGDLEVPPFRAFVEEAGSVQELLPAPFSVLVHGDLNNDNLIYDRLLDRVYLVDVYRSRDFDYVQDAAVFLVSNFRLPVFDPALRNRIDAVCLESLRAFKAFAEERGDRLFSARLALGLSRAFITSTRFELNHRFAGTMFQRGCYLLEKLRASQGARLEEFSFPVEVILY